MSTINTENMFGEKRRWTKKDEHYVFSNYGHMSDEQISLVLHRTPKAVRRKRQKMNLWKLNGRGIIEKRPKSKPQFASDGVD